LKYLLDKLSARLMNCSGHFEILLDGNAQGLNVLVLTEYINATYFISFDIPLRPLHAEGALNLAVASQKHVVSQGLGCWELWADDFRPDVVVMTRYGDPSGRAILDAFKRRGVPVMYHIDDDLLEIPQSLGSEIQMRQGAPDVVETRRYLLANCDLIYTSTAPLAELMSGRFPGRRVFHGIYAPYMGPLGLATKPTGRARNVIGYMGSKGHQLDLELVVPTLERLLEERPALGFEVFGTIKMPPRLARFGTDRVRSHAVQATYRDFLVRLSELDWCLGLAPLVDGPFNRCKAPTKFIEYTASAIPVIASGLPVYSDVIPKNGGRLVDNDWYTPIIELLDDPLGRQNIVRTAQIYAESKYSIEILQQQVMQIFKQIERLN
jgi:glycosyltransferase involved in cell wall biosynthesis